MSLLPPDDDLDVIHTRAYETKVYRLDDHTVLARGVVCDTKRPGLYVEDDPDSIDIHKMLVELEVSVPDLTITKVTTTFQTFPNDICPDIAGTYDQLVGLSIARGFTHKIRELFGGPRGCTHVMALLQALAPAVVQSTWSLSLLQRRAQQATDDDRPDPTSAKFAGNVNTCHVWADDGQHVATIRRGEQLPPPIPVRERLVKLGREPSTWRRLG